MAELAADIIAMSDYVYGRTRGRLEGLTDAEYLWEPVPGCWSVRRGESEFHADGVEEDGVAPFTTIAWRLWHLAGCYGSSRNAGWLGVRRPPGRFGQGDPAPATAAEAVAALEDAHALWRDLLRALPSEAWPERLGPVAGPYAEEDKASFVLHMIDEQVHHGAEIGVLRDLYRAGR